MEGGWEEAGGGGGGGGDRRGLRVINEREGELGKEMMREREG